MSNPAHAREGVRSSHNGQLALALVLSVLSFGHASANPAGTLRVEPVLVEVFAPGAASMLTLRNDSGTDMTAQIRVFRWSQANGTDTLAPTSEVAASPPIVKLAPGTDYVARIVRVARKPVTSEESYRILVDQLPQPGAHAQQQIDLVVRQSIPVFFRPSQGGQPAVAWSLAYDHGQLVVIATNSGGRRLRVSSLTLRDGSGRKVSFGNGLVGYVLSHSSMRWIAPASARRFGSRGSIEISGQGDTGPIDAVVKAPAGP